MDRVNTFIYNALKAEHKRVEQKLNKMQEEAFADYHKPYIELATKMQNKLKADPKYTLTNDFDTDQKQLERLKKAFDKQCKTLGNVKIADERIALAIYLSELAQRIREMEFYYLDKRCTQTK